MKMPLTCTCLLSLTLLTGGQVYADDKPATDEILKAAQGLMAPTKPAASADGQHEQDAMLEAASVLLGGKPKTPPSPDNPSPTEKSNGEADKNTVEKTDEESDKTYGTLFTKQSADGQTLTYFKVGEGASLSRISVQIYGNPNKLQQLYEANQDKISTPDQIRAGITLLIPNPPLQVQDEATTTP
ncbi:MAG TPA: hypothetical protein PLE99_10195 [Candidatus Thiothrix moscowensis]|uniref:LysM peptidoglycan-binding domain-containing protein n=1 Tax=Thiothrix sp. UBA2016 TaxID=1947695 RepID=UPI0025DF982A|nr:hypothetical protein [Thiothrix sp. UBA2016]HRJ53130.1 hypothetical protein [Candidatus Thiothrix moscowensis]HRJ93121.1 hypothetical protein [Candidatus Thiothrix moscowensis]